MKYASKYALAVFASGLVLCCSTAGAQDFDTIKTLTGLMPGVIKDITPTEVVVNQNAGDKRLPVNEVEWIRFKNEPRELSEARNDAVRGAYEDVLTGLAKIKLSGDERPEVKQDVEYYTALAKSRLALAGKGDVAEAGKLVLAFINNKENAKSYHLFTANELLGDLLTANGNYEQAGRFYAEVAKAPWPDYKMRATLSLGRALVAQKKHDEAQKRFDEVLGIDASGKQAAAIKMMATLGKAECMAETGKADEAVKLAEQVIQKAPADAHEVYARAYTTLGSSYRKQNQPKEALLAYLHVPVLFSAYPESHAEALANLRTLWVEVNQPERAKEAEQLLLERYPNSRWVKQ